MRDGVKTGVVVGIFLLSILSEAAVSLGSSSDVNYLRLEPGAYGVFKASFFNMGEDPMKIEFEVECPSDLRIEVVPYELSLDRELTENPDSSGSWLILDGGRRYVKTQPVEVYVKIPSTISRNLYKIKLIATATGQENSGGEGFRQSLVQIREIVFTAHVPGRVSRGDVETTRKDESSGDKVREEAEESFSYEYQGDTLTLASPAGSSLEEIDSTEMDGGGKEDISRRLEDDEGDVLGVTTDYEGNTNINLPTGKISLSKEQTETALDVGLVTLIISVASLVVRILK
jgi:hypothetical protein